MKNQRHRSLNLSIAVTLLFLLIGILINIMKWPFGFEIKLISFLLVGFLYGTRFSLKPNKTIKDRVKAWMVFSFVMVEVLIMLKIRPVFYISYFGLACGIAWIVLEIRDNFKSVDSPKKPNYVLIAGLMCLVYYVISRFLFWPVAFLSQIIGIFLTSIGFFIEHGRLKKIQKLTR